MKTLRGALPIKLGKISLLSPLEASNYQVINPLRLEKLKKEQQTVRIYCSSLNGHFYDFIDGQLPLGFTLYGFIHRLRQTLGLLQCV